MKTLKARLNHGRWIVDCPNCNGAEFAVPGQDFVCMSEWVPKAMGDAVGVEAVYLKAREMAKRAKQVYAVAFPDSVSEIERVLSARPAENRNWTPGESVDDLKQENRAHKVKTPRRKVSD